MRALFEIAVGRRLIFLTILSPILAEAATLQVEVYNLATNVPIQEVRETLERIFAYSSIQLAWLLRDPKAPEGQVIVIAGNGKSPRHVACAARVSISLRIAAHAPPDDDTRELGFSLPFAPTGVNVVVYFDRVLGLSRGTDIPIPGLLAHAIAHEIGHVLLKMENHTTGGLMTDTWLPPELQRCADRIWFSTGPRAFKSEKTWREMAARMRLPPNNGPAAESNVPSRGYSHVSYH